MLDEVKRLLDEPLDDDELKRAAYHAQGQARVYDPGARYDQEVKLEKERVTDWMGFWVNKVSNHTRDYFCPARVGKEGAW